MAGDLKHHRAHCDVTVMFSLSHVDIAWMSHIILFVTFPPHQVALHTADFLKLGFGCLNSIVHI